MLLVATIGKEKRVRSYGKELREGVTGVQEFRSSGVQELQETNAGTQSRAVASQKWEARRWEAVVPFCNS
jgi:hypothetical protein